MIELELNKIIGDITASFKAELKYRINLVTGESASGKSFLVQGFREAINLTGTWEYSCNKEVVLIQDVSALQVMLQSKRECLFIIDEDTLDTVRSNRVSVSMRDIIKSHNYFLLFDRQSSIKVECDVKAVYVLASNKENGHVTYRLDPYFKLGDTGDVDASKYKYLITEDSMSGKTFFKKLLHKLEVVDLNGDGSGALAKTITPELLKHGIVIALDYDCGAVALQSIIHKCRENGWTGTAGLIPMECFEEIVCNSDFILDAFPEMKDKVLNYEKYLSADDKHAGKYFARLLKEHVKQRPPVETHSDRNVEKFYSKGAGHIENCLTEDCCKYSKEDDCKLYVNGDKQDKMLSNKFDWLNDFR